MLQSVLILFVMPLSLFCMLAEYMILFLSLNCSCKKDDFHICVLFAQLLCWINHVNQNKLC